RLQRDAPVCKCGAYENDTTPVTPEHSIECTQRSVYLPEVSDFRYAFVFLCLHFSNRGKHAIHCIVYPYVYWSKLFLGFSRGVFDCIGVSDIDRKDKCPTASLLNLPFGAFKAVDTSGNESYVTTVGSKLPYNRTSQTGRRTCYNHDPSFLKFLVHLALF